MNILAELAAPPWYHITLSPWKIVGLAGSAIFALRFFIQWIASERARKSVIPVGFWECSALGSILTLSYFAIYRHDSVGILQTALPLPIYLRNLYFRWTHHHAQHPGTNRARRNNSAARERPKSLMTNDDLIYLDNNSSTRIDPEVLEEMMPYLTERYGNPSSSHRFGAQVKDATKLAHERVAALLGCQPNEIVFTSGGTESDNTALHSALQMTPGRKHIVTTSVEHNAVLNFCQTAAKRGCEVTIVPVNGDGHLDLAEVERAIRPETAVVSVMWANNETGVIFPLEEIAAICREKGVVFHTDAVQAAGKMVIDLSRQSFQFLSLSGHKLHASKGVGALFVSRNSKFHPMVIGGPQEGGRRAGTDNVASIVGLGKAAELAAATIEEENTHVRALRDRFEETIREQLDDVAINGDPGARLPNTSNLAFLGVDAQAILIKLDQEGVCCSLGSSCTTGAVEPSHVLRAMHLTNEHARSSLRFSFGRYNTEAELDRVLEIIPRIVRKLRQLTPALA